MNRKNIIRCIMVLLLFSVIIFTTSCNRASKTRLVEETPDDYSMFIEVESTYRWMIVYDKETKVMYSVSKGRNYGVFTVLINADGTPKLWNEYH